MTDAGVIATSLDSGRRARRSGGRLRVPLVIDTQKPSATRNTAAEGPLLIIPLPMMPPLHPPRRSAFWSTGRIHQFFGRIIKQAGPTAPYLTRMKRKCPWGASLASVAYAGHKGVMGPPASPLPVDKKDLRFLLN
jgi:hypothetical protein